jgi:ribosomal protein S18 acetylase RimI-like enzyme
VKAVAYAVRTAEERDVDAIVGLWHEFVNFHHELDGRLRRRRASRKRFATLVRSLLESDRDRVVVAETAEGRLIGYALGSDRDNAPVLEPERFGLVSDIYVDEGHRREGVAGALFSDLENWFRVRGLTSVELGVLHVNTLAQAFWRAQGFTDFVDRLRRDL